MNKRERRNKRKNKKDRNAKSRRALRRPSGLEAGVAGKLSADAMMANILRKLWAAKVDPAKIYAIWKSDGLIPTNANIDLIDPDALDEFEFYIEEFIDCVGSGVNPFTGSVLAQEWQREPRPSPIMVERAADMDLGPLVAEIGDAAQRADAGGHAGAAEQPSAKDQAEDRNGD